MEQRRFLLFFVLSMGILLVWTNLLAPIFFPPPPRPVAQQNEADDADPQNEDADEQDAGDPDPEKPAADPAVAESVAQNDAPAEQPTAAENEQPAAEPEVTKLVDDWDPQQIERRTLTLGSLDPQSGYFMEVEVTSAGAGIERLQLNDPRYKAIDRPGEQLTLIETKEGIPPALASVFHESWEPDEKATPLDLIDWQVAKDADGNDRIELDESDPEILKGVTFRAVYEQLGIEVLKTFRLEATDKTGDQLQEARESWSGGYELHLETTVRNLTDEKTQAMYQLQGPVGVPLENRKHARRHRQIALGYLDPDGELNEEMLTTSAVVDLLDDDKVEIWTSPIAYLGLDLLYFAALIVPEESQLESQQIAVAQPMLVDRDARDVNFSDISVLMNSAELTLLGKGKKLASGSPGDTVTHKFKLYAGPKRKALLEPNQAGEILDYGTMGALAGVMLLILNGLHGLGLPYGIAIIFLTIIVRACLFPISRKQALGAQKMKEIQPKLQELKKKYGKDKEKMARAQMELFRKNNYNPLSGCLPLLLQFPIFISLYTALSTSIDLRLAPFLWFDNLAAPDNLFNLPITLPVIGNSFNLLPILTIVLFIVQQKLFMPPPTSEEQAMQFKMMKVMMVVMGFLFYNVPSGLCLYFIASSLWGIGERKMLDVNRGAAATDSKDNSRKTTIVVPSKN